MSTSAPTQLLVPGTSLYHDDSLGGFVELLISTL